jgi:hypothetical protein
MKKIFVNLIVLVGMLVSLLAFSGGAPAYASSDILFNPTSVTFHSQLVLTQESLHAVTVTLTNSTSSTMALGFFIIGSSDFQIPTNNCISSGGGITTLQPNGQSGDSCTLFLQFFPQRVGTIIGQLLIYAPDDTTLLGALDLSGTGLAGTELTKNGLFSSGTKIPTSWVKIGTWSGSDGRFCNIFYVSSPCAVRFVQGLSSKGASLTILKPGAVGSAFYFSLWAMGISVPTTTAAKASILLYNGLKLVNTFPLPITYTGTYRFSKATTWFIAPHAYTKVVVNLYYTARSGTLWYDNVSLLWAPP